MRSKFLLGSIMLCFILAGAMLLPGTASAAVPVAPSNLVVGAGDATSIALSWHDNSSNEDGFNVYRKGPGEADYTNIGHTAAGFTHYGDSGLMPGSTYYYRIKSFNEDGESVFSNTEHDTTEAAVVNVTSPNGGEVWHALEHHDITWTSNGEGFDAQLRYRVGSGTWVTIDTLPNTNSYEWTIPNLDSDEVRVAVRLLLDGDLVCVDQSENDFTIQPFMIVIPGELYVIPNAPTDLNASAETDDRILLSWDYEGDRDGIEIERKTGSGAFALVGQSESGANQFGDTGLNAGTTYTYRIRAYNETSDGDRIYSAYSNQDSATTLADTTEPEEDEDTTPADHVVLRFYIDSTEYYVQDSDDASASLQTMDTAPIISGGRTLLPIRYVSEPLGADVDWEAALDQVTVELGSKTIVMWINNGTARINGVETAIDPSNPDVTPIIVPPGRTMLPLRFIAENLGCDVEWNAATREVTVTYPAS